MPNLKQVPLYDPEHDEANWQRRALAVRLSWTTNVRIGRTSPRIGVITAERDAERDRQEAERLGVLARFGGVCKSSRSTHVDTPAIAARQRRAKRAATIYTRMVKRSQETLVKARAGGSRPKSGPQDGP